MDKEIKELLEEIEWQTRLAHCHSVDSSGGRSQCHICWNEKYQGHREDCKLSQALALLRTKPKCETCGDTREVPDDGEDLGGVCGAAFEISDVKKPCPDCTAPEQPPAGELDYEQLIEDIAENIGVGIHTSLRKALDSKEACIVWDAISNLADGNENHRGEWKVVVDIVAKHIVDFIIKPFVKKRSTRLDHSEASRKDSEKALDWIKGATDIKEDRCKCGRPTGILAIYNHAKRAIEAAIKSKKEISEERERGK